MDTLKKNEEIARKFLKVEKALNSARTPSELLETLFRKLEAEFDIPYIWVSVVKREKDDLQTSLAMPRYLWERVGILDEGSFDTILPLKTAPVLANENLRPFYKLFPENRKFFLKSIAVVPLTLHGEFRGSLNLGMLPRSAIQQVWIRACFSILPKKFRNVLTGCCIPGRRRFPGPAQASVIRVRMPGFQSQNEKRDENQNGEIKLPGIVVRAEPVINVSA